MYAVNHRISVKGLVFSRAGQDKRFRFVYTYAVLHFTVQPDILETQVYPSLCDPHTLGRIAVLDHSLEAKAGEGSGPVHQVVVKHRP